MFKHNVETVDSCTSDLMLTIFHYSIIYSTILIVFIV